ncbi:MAG TPA: transcriptional regulator [Chromatiales bacterium]|nr:transcriptional regulator [Chromatiaceae bacterium]HIO54787.1 transcriptional regulator [Chromatiales bacterium]
MADPKCPDCGVQGIDKIVSSDSIERSKRRTPWFHVAHCSECGYVYGIFSKHMLGASNGPQFVLPDRN